MFVEKFGSACGFAATSEEIVGAWQGAGDGPRNWHPESKEAQVPRTLAAKVDPAHAALVLVDMQNDFCDPSGAVGKRGEDLSFIQRTIPAVRAFLDGARASGVQVVHVKAVYGGLYASDVSLSAGAGVGATACCRPGTWGSDIVEPLRPLDGEWVVTKHRFSPFPDSRLELLLRANGIRTLVICGGRDTLLRRGDGCVTHATATFTLSCPKTAWRCGRGCATCTMPPWRSWGSTSEPSNPRRPILDAWRPHIESAQGEHAGPASVRREAAGM